MKMAYQGVALLIAAFIGIGFAAYQYYTNQGTSQAHSNRSHTYTYVPPPSSDTGSTDGSRKRRRSSARAEECSICQEEMMGNVRNLSCKHKFHKGCIEKWLEVSKICPLCRKTA